GRRRSRSRSRPSSPSEAPTGALRLGQDVDELAAAAVTETDGAVGGGEQRVVAAATDVLARVEARAPLADDDRPRGHDLAAADLHPEALRGGVTPVARRRGTLLLRHGGLAFLGSRSAALTGRDLGDLDHGVVLAVTPAAALVRLALVGESPDLRALGVADDPCLDRGAAQGVGRREDALAVDDEDRRELDLRLGLRAEPLDLEALPGLDPVLLAAGADHCIHELKTLLHLREQPLVEHEPPPEAGRAGLAHGLDESFRDPLPGHLDQTELGDFEDLGAGLVAGEGVAEGPHDLLAVLADLHVDEVDDDDPADVAEAELAGDLVGRLEVVAEHRLLEVRPPDVLAGVDVDDGERLGPFDDQRAAGREPDLAFE